MNSLGGKVLEKPLRLELEHSSYRDSDAFGHERWAPRPNPLKKRGSNERHQSWTKPSTDSAAGGGMDAQFWKECLGGLSQRITRSDLAEFM